MQVTIATAGIGNRLFFLGVGDVVFVHLLQ